MPKVTAFTCGVRFGNCEILVKEALMALDRMGIESELIRLNDCTLQPCKACPTGPCKSKGPAACIYNDDGGWLAQKFYESDGYMMAAPVWSLAPASIVSVFRDRIFGFKADVAGWERRGVPDWAKTYKKSRPGALISVGGALNRNWTSLGLATLYTTTFSAQTNVVDQMDVYGVSKHGDAALREDWLTKARSLGENLGHAVLHPEIDWCGRYLGPDAGEACPSCHASLLIAKPGWNYVECAICGRKGDVSLDNGSLQYTWPEDPQNRLTMMGKDDHIREIESHSQGRPENYEELIREKSKKYREWNDCVLTPPSKEKRD